MTSLGALAGKPPHIDKGPPCSVGLLLTTLDPEEGDLIGAAIERGWHLSDVAKQLREAGYEINAETLSRHYRRRICKCHLTT